MSIKTSFFNVANLCLKFDSIEFELKFGDIINLSKGGSMKGSKVVKKFTFYSFGIIKNWQNKSTNNLKSILATNLNNAINLITF